MKETPLNSLDQFYFSSLVLNAYVCIPVQVVAPRYFERSVMCSTNLLTTNFWKTNTFTLTNVLYKI